MGFGFYQNIGGKGIATEVSKEIINYGFKTLKLDEIIGIAMSENIGSCTVLEKIGLKFYKFDTYPNEDPNKKYNWYHLKKEDYQKHTTEN